MEVQLTGKYKAISDEYGWNLVESVTRNKVKKGEKGVNAEKTGEVYEANNVIGYNMSFEGVLKKVIHLNLHNKKLPVTLKEFLEEYRKEKNTVEQLIK